MSNIASRLETPTPLINSLIRDIEAGQIKIPQFQRRFVWKAEQALKLLDSIANNYPVGSLLLWRTTSKLAVERNIGDFRLPDTDDLSPTDYVLDGQQRLTVIYSCLGGLPPGEGFEAGYDVRSGDFIELPDDDSDFILPLRHMYKTTKLLDFRERLRKSGADSKTDERLDALIDIFSNYRLPVVLLKDLSVEEVCPIFERINSSGTRLSTYDLMVAATWSHAFDLNEKSEEIQTALEPKLFGDIEGDTVLKCLSAVAKGSIKRHDLFSLRNLDNQNITTFVERTKQSLLKSVDTLSTEFGIYSWDFLPYEALAVITSYVFDRLKTLNAAQTRRLRQWFWRSAISERYRVGGEAFVSRDLENVLDFVNHGNGDPSAFGDPPSASTWKTTGFRSNNSRSRAFILSLACTGPRNITNGLFIDVSDALSNWNKKEFHHIYPRDFLKRAGAPGEHNAIANICMLASSENRAISNRDPKSYLPECIADLGADADAVFTSNAMPAPSKFDYANAGYSDFLDARADLINRLFTKLCNGDLP